MMRWRSNNGTSVDLRAGSPAAAEARCVRPQFRGIMNTKLLIAPFVLAMAVSTARAQNGPSIPPEVETVISGGDWITKDSVEGHYRIVIETEGLEHLISRLRVEWIADPSKS